MNSAVASTLSERLDELGKISANRLLLTPAPGMAAPSDLLSQNLNRKPICELIDQSLVEKAVGFETSVVAMTIVRILSNFVAARRLGIVSGPDGLFELHPGTVRAPDIAFLSFGRLAGGRFPQAAIPAIAPDLVVEVLSPGNTKAEMARKRIEFFHSGTKVIWIVDCADRSVAVYTSNSAVTVFAEDAMLTGGEVLPGFAHPVCDFFADLDAGISP